MKKESWKTISFIDYADLATIDWILPVLSNFKNNNGISVQYDYQYPELKQYDMEVVWCDLNFGGGAAIASHIECYSEKGFMIFKLKYCK